MQTKKAASGPSFRVINRNEVPKPVRRGREAIIVDLPFWGELSEKLNEGLSPYEAISLELKPITDPNGHVVKTEQLMTRIRYQFHKNAWDKKYAVRAGHNGDSNTLYVVDHQTAALTEA